MYPAFLRNVSVAVCVCMRACACVHACVCVCDCVYVHKYMCLCYAHECVCVGCQCVREGVWYVFVGSTSLFVCVHVDTGHYSDPVCPGHVGRPGREEEEGSAEGDSEEEGGSKGGRCTGRQGR